MPVRPALPRSILAILTMNAPSLAQMQAEGPASDEVRWLTSIKHVDSPLLYQIRHDI
jgi:hypothetical protein